MIKKEILNVNMNDDFICKCGNTSFDDGFFPCNVEGEETEPNEAWEGYYKCERCEQIYLPDEEIL